MITAKIDVTKIDKTRLYKGKKGTYLNVVLIPTPNSEYGDYMVKENVSKEDREAGIDGNILGNASEFKKQGNEPLTEEEADSLPF